MAGGAKIVALSLPFTKDIRPKITHAFATKELAKDLKQLKKLKFQEILYPEYIAEYLVAQVTFHYIFFIFDVFCS